MKETETLACFSTHDLVNDAYIDHIIKLYTLQTVFTGSY